MHNVYNMDFTWGWSDTGGTALTSELIPADTIGPIYLAL